MAGVRILALQALLAWSTVLVFLDGAHSDPHCVKGQFFWRPDGTSYPGGPDWSTPGKHGAFVAGPCLTLSAIGLTQTFQKTLILISRSQVVTGYARLPGAPAKLAAAIEVNLESGEQRGLDIITNAFCGSGQNMPDGSMISIGGDSSTDYIGDGEWSLRQLRPCADGNCTFSVVAKLAHSRWYPTTALLGDGRMIIVGGSSAGVGLTTEDKNVPWIEYYPKAKGNNGESYQVPLLTTALPYNLFPFVHVLPSGKVFIFASHMWTLWDALLNKEIPGDYPAIDATDAAGSPLRFSYPTAGTSAMFPLTSANDYAAEIMVCGGSSMKSDYFKPGTQTAVEDVKYPASAKCFRITPEGAGAAWVEESMKYPRVMPTAVLLPEGTVAIVGGMQQGHSGLGKLAHKAALYPELYSTAKHKWYKKPLPASKIPRAYHSEAMLLHDGTVFLAGSNPNTEIVTGGDEFPTEFRSEFFHPPYMMKGAKVPVLVDAPQEATHGTQFKVKFDFPKKAKHVQVVLAQPGYSTHGANHGMRNVILDIISKEAVGDGYLVTVAVPGNRNILPLSWYWLFVVANGVPNREGHACFIKEGQLPADNTPEKPPVTDPKDPAVVLPGGHPKKKHKKHHKKHIK